MKNLIALLLLLLAFGIQHNQCQVKPAKLTKPGIKSSDSKETNNNNQTNLKKEYGLYSYHHEKSSSMNTSMASRKNTLPQPYTNELLKATIDKLSKAEKAELNNRKDRSNCNDSKVTSKIK